MFYGFVIVFDIEKKMVDGFDIITIEGMKSI